MHLDETPLPILSTAVLGNLSLPLEVSDVAPHPERKQLPRCFRLP